MSESTVDSAAYRQVLGHFPTGVTVVAGMHDGAPIGMAIGSFFSISLEPPLVGFCAGGWSSTWPKLREGGKFCVNVLADDQEHVSRVFASSEADKFAGIGWEPSALGSPKLKDALAWIDCTIYEIHPEGDHDLVVGEVHDLAVAREGGPLVFFRGGYAGLK